MREILLDIIDQLFPRHCLICDRRTRKVPLCATCTPRILKIEIPRCKICFSASAETPCELCQHLPLPIIETRFLWSYEDKTRDFVRTLKYRPSFALAMHAALLLRSTLPFLNLSKRYDLIIPVPSSRQSEFLRGFNLCNLLAQAAGKELAVPVSAPLIHRGKRAPQASLPLKERTRGIRSLFQLKNSVVAGKRVLLVDDVITTGATSVTAALTLREGGAQSVSVLALARSPSWDEFRVQIHRSLPPR